MKRYLSTGPLVVALLLAGPALWAQTGIIRGKVLDDKGQPVPEAKVEIDFKGGVNRKLETKTNKRGEYTQVGLQPGNYRITAHKEGLQSAYFDTQVSAGDPMYMQDLKLGSPAAAAAAKGGDLVRAADEAAALSEAGKHDEAIAAYEKILATHPDIPEVYQNIGVINARRKDWPKAEAAFLKVLELKPGNTDATLALAEVYRQGGQKDKAAEVMTKAAGGDTQDPKMLFGLAVAYMNAQKQDEAEAALKKVETLDPANMEVQYFLATIALNAGRTPDAVARLEKYVAGAPPNAPNLATARSLLQALKK